METFKIFFESKSTSFNPYANTMFVWKDKKVIRTNHGVEQFLSRKEIKYKDVRNIFKSAVDKVIDLELEPNEYLFYSTSLDQAFVGAIDEYKNIRLITYLPKGKSYPKQGTKKIVVE